MLPETTFDTGKYVSELCEPATILIYRFTKQMYDEFVVQQFQAIRIAIRCSLR